MKPGRIPSSFRKIAGSRTSHIDLKYLPQEYYHLYNRGNGKQLIFHESENYRFFVQRLREYIVKANSELVAFCLMPNHFHLVVYLGECPDFSNMMRGFTTSYVRSFNTWYHRVGYLFQGNTQMRLVDSDEDLIHLCRYVHINPVTAGLVTTPESWDYSDYRDWISESLSVYSPIRKVRDVHFSSGREYMQFAIDRAAELKIRGILEKKLFGSPVRSPSSP